MERFVRFIFGGYKRFGKLRKNKVCIELYWPVITIGQHKQFKADTRLVFSWYGFSDPDPVCRGFAFGFMVLGFGLGVSYAPISASCVNDGDQK